MNDFLASKVILQDMDEIYSRDIDWSRLSGKNIYISGSYGMLASYIVYFLIYLREKKGIEVSVIAQGRNRKKAEDRFGIYFDKDYFRFTDESIISEGCKKVYDKCQHHLKRHV